ncbi:P27 family phage terminase small subunit [Nocardia globerula]|nr:P27 family phage terminase small subunit [Nocardia globerula]
MEVTPFTPAFPGQEFEGQRPPFEKNNTLSLKHGAHSERSLKPIAEAWVKTALAQCAYLRDPSYEPALLAWARFEAKCDLLHDWIDENGLIDDYGQATPAAKLLPTYEGRAAALRATLGMDPISRAKLQRDAAATQVDLAALMAQEDTEDDRT